MSKCISEDEWETIVRNVPIVSVDLVTECPDGIVLGKRSNEPAKGEWFVPGGRVQKGETLTEAAHRIASEELGLDVEIRESLGAFEHFYNTSDAGESKHYVAHGFHAWSDRTEIQTDNQHDEIEIFESVPESLHEYVEAYLNEMQHI